MTTNNMQAGPNINEESYPGYRNPENFIVVSDRLSRPSPRWPPT